MPYVAPDPPEEFHGRREPDRMVPFVREPISEHR